PGAPGRSQRTSGGQYRPDHQADIVDTMTGRHMPRAFDPALLKQLPTRPGFITLPAGFRWVGIDTRTYSEPDAPAIYEWEPRLVFGQHHMSGTVTVHQFPPLISAAATLPPRNCDLEIRIEYMDDFEDRA